MRIEVYFTGDHFVAYDDQGNRITDRAVLEEIAFHPFPGFKAKFYLDLPIDKINNNATIQDIQVNIDTNNTQRG